MGNFSSRASSIWPVSLSAGAGASRGSRRGDRCPARLPDASGLITNKQGGMRGRPSCADWPQGWYHSAVGEHTPAPLRAATRDEAVDIHQIRAGHWGRSHQHLHRIRRRPIEDLRCPQCNDTDCPAGLCVVCGGGGGADTPAHILLRYPCLLGPRLRALGTICSTERDLQKRDDVVAALATCYATHRSRQATSPPPPRPRARR